MTPRRSTLGLLACLSLGLLAAAPLQAKGKADTFNKAVAELQDSPDDLALRKKVISLARDLPEAPPVPDDVLVLKGKAAFVAKSAESPADYKGAVEAYNKATLLAPWVGDLYYNRGVMEEKAEMPQQAIDDFNLYLFAKPDAEDKQKVLERLGKLDVLLDKKKQQDQAVVQHQQRAAVTSAEHKAWESKKTASTVFVVIGGIGLALGAVELGLGYGNESSSDYTVAPGYSGGVLYNKKYEGKYWSTDSYDTYTTGESQVQTGWLVGGLGLGAMVLGFIMSPGPEPTSDALMDLHGGKLAFSPPLLLPGPHGGLRTQLLRAAF